MSHHRLMGARIRDISGMPCAGPEAYRLSRRLQPDRPEYLDRDDAYDLLRTVVSPGAAGPPAARVRSR